MGSKDVHYSVSSANKGTDDIGIAQLTGTVTGAWAAAAGRWAGKAVMTDTAHRLRKGSPIVIAGTTNYNGNTRVLAVIDANKVVINKAFVAEGIAGTWSQTGGQGAWDAFMPIGADLTAANVTMTFWDDGLQGGGFSASDIALVTFTKDVLYKFPGVIKTIVIATAGNVKLFRAATLRPFGKDAQ